MVVVIGSGGHGDDIASMLDCPVRVSHHEYLTLRDGPAPTIVGINDPHIRARVVEEIESSINYAPAGPLVHPSAVVGAFCSLADGTVIGPLSSLLTEVVLGPHVHVGAGSHLTRVTIGEFTTVAPGVTVCGDVKIGSESFLGAGCVIKNFVTIGNNVTVGCGAVVVKDIPDGATVKGNPAK